MGPELESGPGIFHPLFFFFFVQQMSNLKIKTFCQKGMNWNNNLASAQVLLSSVQTFCFKFCQTVVRNAMAREQN